LVGLPPAVAVRVAVTEAVAVEGSTVSVALADAEFVIPWSVANAPAGMVFVKLPGVLEVTLIVTVQELSAGRVPPFNVKLVPPETALTTPPHKLVRPAGFAIVIPTGKLSTNAVPVNTNGLGLIIDMVSCETPPEVMTSGEKLLTISAETLTTSVAVAVADGVNVIVGG
jgi:hypothetical protein